MGQAEATTGDGSKSPGADASVPRRRRRSSRKGTHKKPSVRRRLRLVYFGLASLWGLMIGSASILTGVAAAGRAPQLDVTLVVMLLLAILLSLAGGGVASAAYQQARKRSR